MNPPKKSKKYWKIVNCGCGGYRDYWGEYDCRHDYAWACDDCPCCLEHQKEKATMDNDNHVRNDKLYFNVEDIESWKL